MKRTKLFVSYSHPDRRWLDLLKVHLALLERRGLVHVWSDTQIVAGQRWDEEIDQALTEANAAVLLISPHFLASDFIWKHEIPMILAHEKKGMVVLPLVVRPCAWLIAPEIADFQARPLGGRALSLATEAEVDCDVAAFVYELAALVGEPPNSMANDEAVVMRALPSSPADGDLTAGMASDSKLHAGLTLDTPLMTAGEVWVGTYYATPRDMRLTILEQDPPKFRAKIEYLDDGSVTAVDGAYVEAPEIIADERLRDARAQVSTVDYGVRFEERRITEEGPRPPLLEGEYLAVVSGSVMVGIWHRGGQAIGTFKLQRGD